jgi:2Fe-2S ferredoxin
MTRITCVQPDGQRVALDITDGSSLMQGAVSAGVAGIEAECGGACSCATCHCYIDEAWTDRVPPANEAEQQMLANVAAERRATSRLSCQVRIGPELDGLTVFLPDRQS